MRQKLDTYMNILYQNFNLLTIRYHYFEGLKLTKSYTHYLVVAYMFSVGTFKYNKAVKHSQICKYQLDPLKFPVYL